MAAYERLAVVASTDASAVTQPSFLPLPVSGFRGMPSASAVSNSFRCRSAQTLPKECLIGPGDDPRQHPCKKHEVQLTIGAVVRGVRLGGEF